MTWTLVKGHKGPVKGLRASGPQGLDPLFTHYSCMSLSHLVDFFTGKMCSLFMNIL
jgi:hypothetical protein